MPESPVMNSTDFVQKQISNSKHLTVKISNSCEARAILGDLGVCCLVRSRCKTIISVLLSMWGLGHGLGASGMGLLAGVTSGLLELFCLQTITTVEVCVRLLNTLLEPPARRKVLPAPLSRPRVLFCGLFILKGCSAVKPR